ncbi:hypothetical protein LIN78_02250 [Leeia sp. TBRC 13508]|uniref:DUF4149 domain-containing protein n=1 Tax=Leeia speluncae TaxID=2884804 RepID=A0ABS8D2G7_9NEIS|nr:hypothetical protein [Leeia speluncae]MCB6182375.1 hypothetical protein [Leeia speluncae]
MYYYFIKFEKTAWVLMLGLMIWMAVWVVASSQIYQLQPLAGAEPVNEMLQMHLQEKVDTCIQFGLVFVLLATVKRFRKDYRRDPFM